MTAPLTRVEQAVIRGAVHAGFGYVDHDDPRMLRIYAAVEAVYGERGEGASDG